MRTDVLYEQVVEHIGKFLENDQLRLNKESRVATAVPGLDSLKLFELLLYLEECFGVELDETVLDQMETVGDLVQYIEVQLQSHPGN